jgi:hypothetical protein
MQGWPCVLKHLSQIDDFRSKYLSKGISIGERPYLTTKIITLSEFFNFVHQVSRL